MRKSSNNRYGLPNTYWEQCSRFLESCCASSNHALIGANLGNWHNFNIS